MPRVLQGEVLEFSLFCNDQQTCLAVYMQQPNLLIPMCMHEPTAYLIWERPLMTSNIRIGRGVQDSPQNRTLSRSSLETCLF